MQNCSGSFDCVIAHFVIDHFAQDDRLVVEAMAQKHYYTYIVASLTGTLYIGVTGKIDVRIKQHKSGEV